MQKQFSTWLQETNQSDFFEESEMRLLRARFENKPISTYPESYYSTSGFASKIGGWMSLSRVTSVLDTMMLNLLKRYFMERCRGLTFEEFDEALWTNALGENWEKVEAFNRLDVFFLAAVIVQYNKYRKILDKKYKESLEKIPKKPVEITPAQRDFMYVEKAVVDYDLWLSGETIHGAATLYDNLVRMELIPTDELLLEALKGQIKDRYGAGTYNNKTSAFEASWISNILKDEVKLESTAEIEAKTALLIGWFRHLKDANTSLPELLVENFNKRHSPLTISLSPISPTQQPSST